MVELWHEECWMASPDGGKTACLSTWVIQTLRNRMLRIIGSALLWLDSIFVLLVDERTMIKIEDMRTNLNVDLKRTKIPDNESWFSKNAMLEPMKIILEDLFWVSTPSYQRNSNFQAWRMNLTRTGILWLQGDIAVANFKALQIILGYDLVRSPGSQEVEPPSRCTTSTIIYKKWQRTGHEWEEHGENTIYRYKDQ